MHSLEDKDRYKISQVIGEGATSTVYKALDKQKNRVVAIKVFSSRGSVISAVMHRVQKEFSLLSSLDCEHVVKAERCLKTNSFVMEYCDSTLISFLNEHELDVKGIKKIMRMILLGVYEIHKKGIIHRDLKLGNILLKGDSVKIADFGLSCYIHENDFSYCGTRDYLAPEVSILNPQLITEKENTENKERYNKNCKQLVYANKNEINKEIQKNEFELQSNKKTNEHFYSMYKVPTSITVETEIKYDQKIDIFATGMIYKILLSRKKHVQIEDIEVSEDVKDLLKKLSAHAKHERPSALEALKHKSFNDLFLKVLDFRLLKAFEKQTKYGHISKKNENTIEITTESINLKIIARETNIFDYYVVVNEKETEECLLCNTMLKYFNFLVRYITLICDKTIRYKMNTGEVVYYETLSGIKIAECNRFRAKTQKGESEIVFFDSSGKVMEKRSTFPNEIKSIFAYCEQRRNTIGQTKEKYSVEQISSINISIHPENLTKKHQFVQYLGWCLKEGRNYTILCNDGTKMGILVDEQCVVYNDSDRVLLKDLDSKQLGIIDQFMRKYDI